MDSILPPGGRRQYGNIHDLVDLKELRLPEDKKLLLGLVGHLGGYAGEINFSAEGMSHLEARGGVYRQPGRSGYVAVNLGGLLHYGGEMPRERDPTRLLDELGVRTAPEYAKAHDEFERRMERQRVIAYPLRKDYGRGRTLKAPEVLSNCPAKYSGEDAYAVTYLGRVADRGSRNVLHIILPASIAARLLAAVESGQASFPEAFDERISPEGRGVLARHMGDGLAGGGSQL